MKSFFIGTTKYKNKAFTLQLQKQTGHKGRPRREIIPLLGTPNYYEEIVTRVKEHRSRLEFAIV